MHSRGDHHAPARHGGRATTLTVSDGRTFHEFQGVPSSSASCWTRISPRRRQCHRNSFGLWVTHSAGTGATGQTQVVEGRLHLKAGDSEDISRGFSNFYQPVDNGIVLYSAFKVNLATLPTGNNGNYFAHFRDIGTGFRARVFAATNGAAPGKFRFHISNGGFVLAGVPQDLELNTTYLVLTRYNVDTAESTLWVNPTAEAVGGVTAVDNTTPITLYWVQLPPGGRPQHAHALGGRSQDRLGMERCVSPAPRIRGVGCDYAGPVDLELEQPRLHLAARRPSTERSRYRKRRTRIYSVAFRQPALFPVVLSPAP